MTTEAGTSPAEGTGTGTSTDPAAGTESTSPGSNAATGVGQTTNGAGAPRTADACSTDGTPLPPREDQADTDGDGTPNETDRDDDNDGIPDRSDRDEDGDGNPDVTDPDDDGDGVPDPLDGDSPPVEPGSVVDTDGDGTPDSRDGDDDGDGVVDTRDGDADGDGQPEVKEQPLSEAVTLPASIDPGETVVLLRGEPVTVAGAVANATVGCAPSMRSGMKAPAGDLGPGAVTRLLCTVTKDGKSTRIRVHGNEPTRVVVTFTAPAVGDYLPLRDVRTYRVSSGS